MDDLKLFARKEDTVMRMMAEVDQFFRTAGLEQNAEKSATNLEGLSSKAKLLDGIDGYRYLGVLEDKDSRVLKNDTMNSISDAIEERINSLADSKLNSANFFKAVNEHALSLYNYYIGLIDIEP
ncbi:uncharacterized protein LOC115230393 [Octopus sinensis]|uniref:Uncharacterized protein LOC115230393 n=1 Tax=Octopus sinensis TaxID=2607531 RepID=A0A6P7TVQ1_9MOLL|nr:uncharacterized protein LOC115230393 [Octopus sinensis]